MAEGQPQETYSEAEERRNRRREKKRMKRERRRSAEDLEAEVSHLDQDQAEEPYDPGYEKSKKSRRRRDEEQYQDDVEPIPDQELSGDLPPQEEYTEEQQQHLEGEDTGRRRRKEPRINPATGRQETRSERAERHREKRARRAAREQQRLEAMEAEGPNGVQQTDSFFAEGDDGPVQDDADDHGDEGGRKRRSHRDGERKKRRRREDGDYEEGGRVVLSPSPVLKPGPGADEIGRESRLLQSNLNPPGVNLTPNKESSRVRLRSRSEMRREGSPSPVGAVRNQVQSDILDAVSKVKRGGSRERKLRSISRDTRSRSRSRGGGGRRRRSRGGGGGRRSRSRGGRRRRSRSRGRWNGNRERSRSRGGHRHRGGRDGPRERDRGGFRDRERRSGRHERDRGRGGGRGGGDRRVKETRIPTAERPEACRSILFTGLPNDYSEQNFYKVLSEVVPVQDIRFIKNNALACVPTLEDLDALIKEVREGNIKFNGNVPDKIEWSEWIGQGWGPTSDRTPGSTTLFVGNVPYKTDEMELREVFGRHGEITNIQIASNGYIAHIRFMEERGLESAIAEMCGVELKGRKLRLDYAEDRKGGKGKNFRPPPKEKPPGCCTVWIGGVTKDITEEGMKEEFKDFGAITRVSITAKKELKGDGGKAKGKGQKRFTRAFVHIEFAPDTHLDQAILSAIHEVAKEHCGSQCNVDWAAGKMNGKGGKGGGEWTQMFAEGWGPDWHGGKGSQAEIDGWLMGKAASKGFDPHLMGPNEWYIVMEKGKSIGKGAPLPLGGGGVLGLGAGDPGGEPSPANYYGGAAGGKGLGKGGDYFGKGASPPPYAGDYYGKGGGTDAYYSDFGGKGMGGKGGKPGPDAYGAGARPPFGAGPNGKGKDSTPTGVLSAANKNKSGDQTVDRAAVDRLAQVSNNNAKNGSKSGSKRGRSRSRSYSRSFSGSYSSYSRSYSRSSYGSSYSGSSRSYSPRNEIGGYAARGGYAPRGDATAAAPAAAATADPYVSSGYAPRGGAPAAGATSPTNAYGPPTSHAYGPPPGQTDPAAAYGPAPGSYGDYGKGKGGKDGGYDAYGPESGKATGKGYGPPPLPYGPPPGDAYGKGGRPPFDADAYGKGKGKGMDEYGKGGKGDEYGKGKGVEKGKGDPFGTGKGGKGWESIRPDFDPSGKGAKGMRKIENDSDLLIRFCSHH